MDTTEPKKYVELRLNTQGDAIRAVHSFIKIQADALKADAKGIMFLIERSQQTEIQKVLGTFFRKIPTFYKVIQASSDSVFYPLPEITFEAAKAPEITKETQSVPLEVEAPVGFIRARDVKGRLLPRTGSMNAGG